MKKRFQPALCVCLAIFLSVQMTGCVALVVGGAAAGGTAYVLGDLQGQVETSPAAMRSAIIAAGKDLKLHAIDGFGDELTGKYTFRTASDQKILVKYVAETSTLMKLSIRVGNFGDEALSRRIDQAIQKRL